MFMGERIGSSYWNCAHLLEIFKEGYWKQLDNLQDKELVHLRDNLQVSLADARASSTSTKYANAFLCCKRWGELQPDLRVLPVDPQHLFVFAAFERGLSFKVGSCRSCECCCMGSPVSRAGGCV